MIQSLKQIYHRDLLKLKSEIEAYQSNDAMWQVVDGISNSGGNLCLHLIGNLNTYIGKDLGKIPYERNRPLEFSDKDVPKSELLNKIDATIEVVNAALDSLEQIDLTEDFPYVVLEKTTSKEYMLIHLASHLSYHLGQINYHRRIVGNC
jgi:Protein of unknown function (DUF1572)